MQSQRIAIFMGVKMGKNIFLAVLLAGALLLAGCVQQEKGYLEGKVTIGPLCPVEPCKVTPEQMAHAYAARKIVVYAQDKATIVKELDIASDGTYRTDLAPGTYLVDIKHQGLDSSAEIPKEIRIEPGKTAILDVSIDTGLR